MAAAARRTCVVVGAGITGAAAAWYLTTQVPGWRVVVHEAQPHVGGQLRAEFLGGIPYEPHGPHIFHTASREARDLVAGHCDLNSYQHRVITVAGPAGYHLTWPLQRGELEALPEWPRIRAELDSLPARPSRASFEAYATGIMGATLYEWCCYGYTVKQWGTEPRLLSAGFAPKRLDLRSDGDRRMFRDPYQGWCEGGWHTLVQSLLSRADVELGSAVTLADLPAADAYVITAPLDEFLGAEPLPWRGVRTGFTWSGTGGDRLPAPVVNYPDPDVPFTRMVETRQMSQAVMPAGSVTGREYPGAPARHYPVDDVAGENRARHRELAGQVRREIPNAVLAGRLANYVYIDIDQAVMQGLNAARKIAGESGRE
jgi:UDP-galactopyranose mutase